MQQSNRPEPPQRLLTRETQEWIIPSCAETEVKTDRGGRPRIGIFTSVEALDPAMAIEIVGDPAESAVAARDLSRAFELLADHLDDQAMRGVRHE
ncbi:hypothetical protein CDO52_12720 [Nocardiopsis gilva YIM 90087]|uniref:Uncharacterized protein n=1 Tax=Nocardiopsis gilva YIM 90087 TaxID=1235441 RepID=A0A223S5Z4_9ACTN|nr:hypothetical protein [Nocardiopsis gilva]ASU83534.1 hypothetical protein CDO52_12720 [Nocardiopsis gilva YIM 90087]